jgi:hypothetical protein
MEMEMRRVEKLIVAVRAHVYFTINEELRPMFQLPNVGAVNVEGLPLRLVSELLQVHLKYDKSHIHPSPCSEDVTDQFLLYLLITRCQKQFHGDWQSTGTSIVVSSVCAHLICISRMKDYYTAFVLTIPPPIISQIHF